jgi:hypothetical protein
VFLAMLALAATVPRAARAQAREWTTPVYRPPPAPAPAPAPSDTPAAPAGQPAASPPGYAPGYGPPAYVPPDYTAPPPEPVHQGLYLRLHLGASFSSFSTSGGATQISGGGIALGLALGYAIAPNLALFVLFSEPTGEDLKVKTSSIDLTSTSASGLGCFGAGAVYYLEPINVYLSGAIAMTAVVYNDAQGNMLDDSDTGIGFVGMVGKEWRMSQSWGVGAAVEIVAATAMKDHDDPTVSWNAQAFNVVFSATYF